MSESFRAGYFNADAPAFSDDGRPEASVDFVDPFADEREPGDDTQAAGDDEDRVRRETIIRLLALLLDGARDAATIGRSAVLVAAALRMDGAPSTVEELGTFLRVSHQAASKGLRRTREKLQQMATI